MVGGQQSSSPPDVVLRRLVVSSCRAQRGAGVAVSRARVAVDRCVFVGNVAAGCGGALHADRSAVLLLDSSFSKNEGTK